MQGYAELRRPMRAASVQKLLARLGCDPKCHVEPAYACREHNKNYCGKGEQPHEEWVRLRERGPNWGLNAAFYEGGDWESGGQGTRNDITHAVELAKTAPTAWELIEQFPSEYCKYSRGLDRIRVLAAKRAARQYRPIEVHVLWGDPGTRKTDQTGLNRDHDVFPVACGDTFPFDNYDGEGTIVFDDFYGQLRCADMLSWCNGQYGSVTIKGGSAYRAWSKVYITSNTAPDTWYPNVPQNVRAAFLSRLTTVTHVVGASQRPPTRYFVLNTLSGERNEVDCNTTGSPCTATSVSPGVPRSPLLTITDELAVQEALALLDDVPVNEPVKITITPAPNPPIATCSPKPNGRPKGKSRKLARLARGVAALAGFADPTLSTEELETIICEAGRIYLPLDLNELEPPKS